MDGCCAARRNVGERCGLGCLVGATTRVHGRVGDDLQGRTLRDAITAHGVEAALTVDPEAPTGTMLVLHEPGERSMVADRGANARLAPRTCPPAIQAGAVLVSGYLLLQQPGTTPPLRPSIGPTRRLVAVDASSWPLVQAFGVDRFFEATAAANAVLANDREAEILTGPRARRPRRRWESATGWRRSSGGPAGRRAGRRGAVSAPAELIAEVDPTGAGDAFDGVLLRGSRAARSRRGAARAGHAGALVAACAASGPRRPRRPGAQRLEGSCVADEVRAALTEGRGVVALETSVIGQGLPAPRNAECVERMGGAIASAGAVPAWIGAWRARSSSGSPPPSWLASRVGRGDEGRAPRPARRGRPGARARRR